MGIPMIVTSRYSLTLIKESIARTIMRRKNLMVDLRFAQDPGRGTIEKCALQPVEREFLEHHRIERASSNRRRQMIANVCRNQDYSPTRRPSVHRDTRDAQLLRSAAMTIDADTARPTTAAAATATTTTTAERRETTAAYSAARRR